MGVNLKPIIVKNDIELEDLRDRDLAVDSSNILYQFLSTIRTSKGMPLTDKNGHVTSHLVGLLYRSTKLIYEYNIPLVFIFDGGAPTLKAEEMKKRAQRREEAKEEYERALERGDFDVARSKAMQAAGFSSSIFQDAKILLEYLGIPYVQAKGEAEAQGAYMASKGDVWGVNSRDYDCLLFGTPRLVRYLTISASRRPDLVVLEDFLDHNGITREQLVDMAILMGTDYNKGIYRVGPKTGLKWIRRHGRIENLPDDKKKKVTPHYEEIRRIFLEPKVVEDYSVEFKGLREEQVYSFLCDERGFPKNRVKTAVERMKQFYEREI
ncbi:flap endonuclease-1 [Candidatus Bathyarchaeota archaeon]|jgi:flap endonuclease-1|nr:flap endonuclease-1 [Candidatus Bathyarchaeota archaeon]